MDSPRPPLAQVEDVREELRRLGYLDHGVDRFVLAGAKSATPLRASIRAAARVGLLGGVLFGAASTLAAAGIDPRLRTEPRDLVILALYLTVILGAVISVAALVAGLAAAWLGTRLTRLPRPTLSRDVGLALATLGLAYVALWWLSHAAEMSTAMQAASLLVGVALCAALGRFGSLAAVAVLSAGGLGGRLPEASLSRRHLLPLVAAIAIAFAAAVAGAAVLGSSAPPPPVDFAVVPTGLVVRIVGIDGLDRRMAEEMIARGEMPHLQALLAASAHAPLRAEPEQVPAIVWTTIATGRGPAVHGIHSAGARHLPGMRTPVPLADRTRFSRAVGSATDLLRLTRTQPASSVLRGAKAFWNVASEKGLRVLVVNWWATWPADRVNGQVVTDRALLKLEKGGRADRETHPDDLLERLRPLAAADAPHDRARRIDGFAAAVARMLHHSAPVSDLEAVYLPGLDIVTMQQLGDAAGDVATLSGRMDAVRGHHRFIDELLGGLRADMPANGVLLLVGDPGRRARQTGSAEGLIVLSGAGIIPGTMAAGGERDVAPTVLHLLGTPVSDELEGRVLEAALSPAFRAAHPVRRVSSYGLRPQGRLRESAFDREMLEELRSLGYIQ
jgi:type I phosphodiesterase/nucleotide pyrophosphatase